MIQSQGYKRWMPSTNFEEPNNWDSGKLPCSGDRVVFPKSTPPVFVQTNTTLTELVSRVTYTTVLRIKLMERYDLTWYIKMLSFNLQGRGLADS